MASVYREAEDRLSRQRWDFTATMASPGGFGLILSRYSIERRKAAKGRWPAADSPDRWEAMDERFYNSQLPRPSSISADVLAEAWRSIERTTYIGWRTAEHALP